MKFTQWSLIVFIMLFFIACSKSPELPEPIPMSDQTQKDINSTKSPKVISVSFPENFKIIGIKNQEEKALLLKAYQFLYEQFGKAKYDGKIIISITDEQIAHPKVTWLIGEKKSRTVHLSRFYMYDSELPTITHELFHALYQTNEVIEAYPEFILEGMAIYVENLYKYRDQKKVKTVLQKLMKNDDVCNKMQSVKFNDAFEAYDARMVYYLYITGGSFFAQQEDPLKLIKDLLGAKKPQRISVSKIMEKYGIKEFTCKVKHSALEFEIKTSVDTKPKPEIASKKNNVRKNIIIDQLEAWYGRVLLKPQK